jgi:hypothetical protein
MTSECRIRFFSSRTRSSSIIALFTACLVILPCTKAVDFPNRSNAQRTSFAISFGRCEKFPSCNRLINSWYEGYPALRTSSCTACARAISALVYTCVASTLPRVAKLATCSFPFFSNSISPSGVCTVKPTNGLYVIR